MATLGDATHTSEPGGSKNGSSACGKRFTHIVLHPLAATPGRIINIVTFFGNLRFLGIGSLVQDSDGWSLEIHHRAKDLFPGVVPKRRRWLWKRR